MSDTPLTATSLLEHDASRCGILPLLHVLSLITVCVANYQPMNTGDGEDILRLYRVVKLHLLLLQVWRQYTEHLRSTSYHSQQVLPAHRNDVSGVLSALEAAQRVSNALVTMSIHHYYRLQEQFNKKTLL